MIQKSVCELCVRIGHKYDACIIRSHKFLPPSLRINMNQYNTFRGDEATEPPREWNIQPAEAHLISSTSPPKTSPVVSDIIGIPNNHAIANVDV